MTQARVLTTDLARAWAYNQLLMRGIIHLNTPNHSENVTLEILAGNGTPGQDYHSLFAIRYISDSGFRTNTEGRVRPEFRPLSQSSDSEEKIMASLNQFLTTEWREIQELSWAEPVINVRETEQVFNIRMLNWKRMDILPPRFLMHCACFQTQMAFASKVQGPLAKNPCVQNAINRIYYQFGAWMEAELERVNNIVKATQLLRL